MKTFNLKCRRLGVVAAVAASLPGGFAIAAESAPNRALGTTSANVPSAKQAFSPNGLPLGSIYPSANFGNAQYATGGVALRNRQRAAIHISGVTGPVQAAVLYWSYLFSASSPPASTQSIQFCYPTTAAPGFACSAVTGRLIATGGDPCWGSSGNAVYRANVRPQVLAGVAATGTANGGYPIQLSSATSATNSGADPWSGTSFPAAEGASLVIVGTGSQKVSIFDVGLSGKTFFSTNLFYTLRLPGAGVSTTPVLWDHVGADGQTGGGRTSSVSNETTSVNSIQIAGPPGAAGTRASSDWDGSSGWPIPQLWDDTGHEVPSSAATVGTTSLQFKHVSLGDCLTPIVDVVAY